MKILVADDSKLARLSLIKSIKGLEPHCEIIEAENGLIAVEQFKENSPSIVFLDLTMPVMDGYEALEKIIAMNSKAQVVVVTADIQSQAQAQVISLGAKMVIPKPISSEKMQAVLEQLVF
ncbi:MAG: response regulator [Sulfuricurvum sp.]|nr:response regulator [Sulfuricurvum sp.]